VPADESQAVERLLVDRYTVDGIINTITPISVKVNGFSMVFWVFSCILTPKEDDIFVL